MSVSAQQDSIIVRFNILFNNAPLLLHQSYSVKEIGDSIALSTLRFYLGNIRPSDDKQTINYHLIDAAHKNSWTFKVRATKAITFNIGIDSITNVSGAMGGDLDPTTGMYWTWQSGYINFKIEGNSPICTARNNVFQYHLGGYAFPNNTLKELRFESSNRSFEVDIHIDQLLAKLNIVDEPQVMSPGKLANDLSDELSKIFELKK